MHRTNHWLRQASDSLANNRRAAFTAVSLGAILTGLITGQILSPGFTRFWGYLTGQVTFILLAALLGEILFSRQGGLSWLTHIAGISCCLADVMGNVAHLYDLIEEYDKITHFFGCAVITSAAYDCLGALAAQGRAAFSPRTRMWVAVGLGTGVGLGWEVYEILADHVFRTIRVYGYWDTFHDVVFDALGAASAGLLMSILDRSLRPAPVPMPRGQDAVAVAGEDVW
jgi:hypothetical protein